MSTPGNAAVNVCRNIWHRNPGALLQCPHCKMTRSEWEIDQANKVSQMPPPQQRQQAGPPPMRISLKYFENSDPLAAVHEANVFAAKSMDDPRTRIVDASYGTRRIKPLAHEGHDVFYVVFVINTVMA